MTSEHRPTLVATLLVFLALVLPSAPAAAQPDFEATVRAALAEFEAGRWTEARALFLEAHAIRPSAEALRMAGNASYEARQYVRSVELLEQALAEERSPLRPDRAELARDALGAANRFVTRVRFVARQGAQLQVDGVVHDATRPVVLDRGEHEVDVRATGFETHRERIVLTTPERTITVDLRASTGTVADPSPAASTPAPAEDRAERSSTWVWVLVGIVAAGAIAGLAVGLAVRDDAPLGSNAPGQVVYALEPSR